MEFPKIGKQKIGAEFDGGRMSSNAGALALCEVEERCQILDRIAEYFSDYRDPSRVEQSIKRLLGKRIFGLCLGFEYAEMLQPRMHLRGHHPMMFSGNPALIWHRLS